jgi:hypothetical protein
MVHGQDFHIIAWPPLMERILSIHRQGTRWPHLCVVSWQPSPVPSIKLCATPVFFLELIETLHDSFLPTSPYFFSGSQRLLTRLTHPFPHFYIPFIYMYCCTYSHPAYNWNIADWTFSKHQSISQSHLDEEERDVSTWSTTFDFHWKSMERLVGITIVLFF